MWNRINLKLEITDFFIYNIRAILDGYRSDVPVLAEKENALMDTINNSNKQREELEAVSYRLETFIYLIIYFYILIINIYA